MGFKPLTMRSLQFKFTLFLLLTSLTAVLLAGAVARHMVLNKFNQGAMQQALASYHTGLQSYISTYGSWQKAQQAMPLRDWMRRQEQNRSGLSGARSAAPNSAAPNSAFVVPRINPLGPRQFEVPQQRGGPLSGPPPQGPLGNGPLEGRPERGSERGGENQGEGGRPGGPPDERGAPSSFRFIVLDPAGRVLMGPPEMRGTAAPRGWLSDALPVKVNGQTAVLVVPYGEPNLSATDRDNLDALKQGIWRGVAIAMLMALSLGLFLGHRLGGDLRQLTGAIEAMGEGRLRQTVQIKSRDEIGLLAGAFNRMSEDLAQAHEKLQQSHAQITQQAAMLKELSVRDELTKLYNRRHYDAQLNQLFEQSRRYKHPLTVMIGDLDHFKRINDTFSHAIGDVVLRHVAVILQKYTRQSDIVARYGGEEFVIAFPETSIEQAHALCERLRAAIEAAPWHQIAPGLRVTMSLGLCDDLTLESAEKMVAGADELLYYAKEHGRNRVCTARALAKALKIVDSQQLQEELPPVHAPA